MRVMELWRYPVKSMLGERLDQAEVGPRGVGGDRRRAVVDVESGVSLSAKRYADLLRCRAWTAQDQVMIGLPDGSEFPADSTDAAEGLSALISRRVVVGTAGTGFIWEPGLEASFDRAPLHLITTATLSELSRLQPDSGFERARFRLNLLVETDQEGFVEDPAIFRTIKQTNHGNAGIELQTEQSGTLHTHDPVTLAHNRLGSDFPLSDTLAAETTES